MGVRQAARHGLLSANSRAEHRTIGWVIIFWTLVAMAAAVKDEHERCWTVNGRRAVRCSRRKVPNAELGDFFANITRPCHLHHHRVALGYSALERVAISRAPCLSSLYPSTSAIGRSHTHLLIFCRNPAYDTDFWSFESQLLFSSPAGIDAIQKFPRIP